MVVFYGDHLPGIFPQGLQDDNGVRRMRETPMFIWSNFEQNRHVALPTTSPTQFLPKVFDLVGAPLPPYYALLHDLDAEIPAMEQGNFINAKDEEVTEDQLEPARPGAACRVPAGPVRLLDRQPIRRRPDVLSDDGTELSERGPVAATATPW